MTNPRKYRKKPVVIEAMHLNESTNPHEVADWCGGRLSYPGFIGGGPIWVEVDTLEGVVTAKPGDYVIRGVHGEFYPVKPEIFRETYEVADD